MNFRRVTPQVITGNITANGGSVSAYVENYSSVIIAMKTSALVGHVSVFEVSMDAGIDPNTGQWDGTTGTWYALVGQRTTTVSVETQTTTLAATPAYGYQFQVGGWRFFRLRATSHTSGTATWSISPNDNPLFTMPSSFVTIGAGTSLIGDVGGQVRATSGGISSIARLPSAAATTNATVVKASAGRVYKIDGYNAAAAVRYIKLYDKATAPTVGTDTPVVTLAIGPSSRIDLDIGLIGEYFAAGISYALTTGAPDADTGALTLADIVGLNIWYA